MAIDTRDWYVSRLRRRLGYRERADWRRPAADLERERGWRPWKRAVALILGAVAASAIYGALR